MINANMRLYNFFTLGGLDAYGQPTIPQDAEPTGQIKMSISISSQSVQDNIMYQGCQYMGLTHDTEVNDTYVIEYGKERLKVLYVSPQGRLKQVFLTRMV